MCTVRQEYSRGALLTPTAVLSSLRCASIQGWKLGFSSAPGPAASPKGEGFNRLPGRQGTLFGGRPAWNGEVKKMCAALLCTVLQCTPVHCAMQCCSVSCHALLCCAALRCAVLCCVVLVSPRLHGTVLFMHSAVLQCFQSWTR